MTAELYEAVKSLHLICAGLSFSLFFLRGVRILRNPARFDSPWLRIAPHGIDTVLLMSGVTLSLVSAQYPLSQGWLTVKLAALVAYILLGMVAFRFARGRPGGKLAWLAALLVFAYIVGVALTRSPL